MGLITNIRGAVSGIIADVTKRGALHVSLKSPDVPSQSGPPRERIFIDRLADSSGATQQTVDGSVTPVEFKLSARTDCDTYVAKLVLVVAATTVANNRWGNINGLPNGYSLSVIQQGEESFIAIDATTVGEFITRTAPEPWGSSPNTFTLTSYLGNADAKVIIVDLAALIGGGHNDKGIKLGRNSLDSVQALVQDDLTGLDEQFVTALGYCRFP